MRITDIAAPKQLYLLLGFALFLIAVRIPLFGQVEFLYLIWNLFLALVPYLISSALVWHARQRKASVATLVFGGAMWLLFFPNSPYLITDLIHVDEYPGVPIWYDVLMIFSSASAGLMFAFHSLYQIEEILLRRFGSLSVRILLLPILLFTSVGIYLGRFPRFNSWDVVTAPLTLLDSSLDALFGGEHYPEAHLFIVLFFLFLWASYNAWRPTRRRREIGLPVS